MIALLDPRRIFSVQGSQTEPYIVAVDRKSNGRVQITCTCPAGVNRQVCKHRIRILMGSDDGVVGASHEDGIETVERWFLESPLRASVQALNDLDTEITRLKRQQAAEKRQLAEMMETGGDSA